MKCYCKSGLDFFECCESILKVEKVAPTALSLMRSRYSAYCLGDVNYLQATTHDHTWSDEELKFIQDWADNSFWQHLEIVDYSDNMVEFKAYYIFNKKQHLHHEKSVFKKLMICGNILMVKFLKIKLLLLEIQNAYVDLV